MLAHTLQSQAKRELVPREKTLEGTSRKRLSEMCKVKGGWMQMEDALQCIEHEASLRDKDI